MWGVGATEIYVAVPSQRDPQPVRSFPTFTAGLRAMAAWLVQCGITTVAMESIGVYRIPPHKSWKRPASASARSTPNTSSTCPGASPT